MDSSNVIDTFETIDDDADRYSREIPSRKLPGFGETRDDCGDVVPHFCGGCGKPQDVGRTCYQWTCPRCAPAAAYRRTVTASAKLESLRQQKTMERDGNSPKFHHVVISPEDLFRANGDPQDLIFEVSKTLLDDLGVMGGILIQHDWRGEGDDDDDRDEWKERLFSGKSWEEVEDDLSHEPHIHAIVLADYIDGNACKAIYDETGIVTHRITRDKDNVSIYDVEDLTSAISYSLSHVAVDDGDAQYRYFGEIANHSASTSLENTVRSEARSVVPQTLDLHTAPLHCDSEYGANVVDDDEFDFDDTSYPFGNSTDSQTDSGGSQANYYCQGKLRHISYAEHVLAERDLLFASELRETYQNWDPPPDDS